MNCSEIKVKVEEPARENKEVLLLSEVLGGMASFLPLAGVAVAAPVKLGMYENYYNVLKGKDTSWKKLYGKFDRQFESSFIFGLYMMIAGILIMAVPIIVLYLISAIIPFLLPIMRLTILLVLVAALSVFNGFEFIGFEFLLLFPDMKGSEAFEKTKEIGKKHWKLFVSLFFKFIGGVFLGTVTCGIYFIKVIPHMNLAFAMLVDELIQGNVPEDGKKDDAVKLVKNEEVSETLDVSGGGDVNAVFCTKCGFKNEAGANFCKKCGEKLSY